MARTTLSESVFFRYEGDSTEDVFLRLNPVAVRYSQNIKGGVVPTLGGYYQEQLYSSDPQHSGKLLPDLTIEAETGVDYRKELERIRWIWNHQSDRKADGSPVAIYFYDLIQNVPFQGRERNADRAWLIQIQNFAWDDSAQNPWNIRFTFRCTCLQDLFGDLPSEPPVDAASLPRLEEFTLEQSPLGQSPVSILDSSDFSFGTTQINL